MASPIITKREFFITSFKAVLDKLNTAILNQEENYQKTGEIIINMHDFPELENEHVREHLVMLLRETGWNAHFNTRDNEDRLILY